MGVADAKFSGGLGVCLATGGHPLPVLLRADGTTEFAGSSGTLLGIVGDPQISSDEVDLRPGDSLIMFTDGVIEASPIDDSFGPERLAEFVAGLAGKDAAEIAAAIETAVLDIQGGTVRDDVAVIVARVC